jgi:hypothetical protein
MDFPLPPPDPYETYRLLGEEDWPLVRPAAVFLGGTPSPEAQRVTDRLLKLRPGALIVVAPG